MKPRQLLHTVGAALLLFLSTLSAIAGSPIVIIDAGHGGHDVGGMPGQLVEEKGYCLDVARRLEARLRAQGFRTIMTRTGDYFVPLGDRTEIANRYSGRAIFVSIHFNGAANADASGIETYYAWGNSSAALASSIHNHVLAATGAEDRRVRTRSFHVLRRTKMPAVLCELGFLTNRRETSKITSSFYRQRLANAVADGISRSFVAGAPLAEEGALASR